MEYQGKPGPGRFQWNRGGWFGGQLGATLWLLLLGGILLAHGRTAGGVVLALGLAINGFGFYLWRARHRFEPYPAIQVFIGGCALVAVVSILLASAAAEASEPIPSLATLLIYPALMAIFHLQERSARKSSD